MICPKCHQPLDDPDEAYICCAGASLQWRCQQCAKVSEGFAFPYGRCPQCGGALAAAEPREVAGAAALAAIRTAFEIELGGQAFYLRAAAAAEDAGLRELFSRFAAMEQEHMDTLARRYHTAAATPTQGLELDLVAVYAGIEGRPQDPANLFRIAIALERRASAFFVGRAEQAPRGSMEEQLYRELAAEEAEHAAILQTEYARWQANKGGLL
jgi:rubrerythrin